MEKILMSASIVTIIVLCIVGLIKLPFKELKSKHAKLYKAIFTIVSIILAIGLSVVNELYILCGQLLSREFVIVLASVVSGVFCGYGGIYEGLGVKELVKKIIENLKKAREIAQNKKAVEYLNRIEDIESAIKLLEERKNDNINEV